MDARAARHAGAALDLERGGSAVAAIAQAGDGGFDQQPARAVAAFLLRSARAITRAGLRHRGVRNLPRHNKPSIWFVCFLCGSAPAGPASPARSGAGNHDVFPQPGSVTGYGRRPRRCGRRGRGRTRRSSPDGSAGAGRAGRCPCRRRRSQRGRTRRPRPVLGLEGDVQHGLQRGPVPNQNCGRPGRAEAGVFLVLARRDFHHQAVTRAARAPRDRTLCCGRSPQLRNRRGRAWCADLGTRGRACRGTAGDKYGAPRYKTAHDFRALDARARARNLRDGPFALLACNSQRSSEPAPGEAPIKIEATGAHAPRSRARVQPGASRRRIRPDARIPRARNGCSKPRRNRRSCSRSAPPACSPSRSPGRAVRRVRRRPTSASPTSWSRRASATARRKRKYARGRIVVWTKKGRSRRRRARGARRTRASSTSRSPTPSTRPTARRPSRRSKHGQLWDAMQPRIVYGENMQADAAVRAERQRRGRADRRARS